MELRLVCVTVTQTNTRCAMKIFLPGDQVLKWFVLGISFSSTWFYWITTWLLTLSNARHFIPMKVWIKLLICVLRVICPLTFLLKPICSDYQKVMGNQILCITCIEYFRLVTKCWEWISAPAWLHCVVINQMYFSPFASTIVLKNMMFSNIIIKILKNTTTLWHWTCTAERRMCKNVYLVLGWWKWLGR